MSNSTPRAALPPLPPPKLLGRETQFGGSKYGIYGYTAEQVEQIRRETVQACAAVCQALHAEYMGMAKGDTKPTYDYMALGALDASADILALLPVKD